MKHHDVVIIGGGIAGLTVAKYLAEEGVDFVLFEEHNDFFKKACGEGIIPDIAGYNFFDDIYESKVGVEREVEETVIHTNHGDVSLYMPYVIVDKLRVERELARQVIKKGGQILMKERVTGVKGVKPVVLPHNIEAEVVVGADGTNSVVRKWLGVKPPHMGFAVEAKSKVDLYPSASHVELKKDVVPYGYSWFFPKKDSWNIGVGAFKMKYFKDAFERFRSRFKETDRWRGAYLPLDKPTKTYGKHGILVGDSASQIISSVGGGNTTAAICGKLAAECIIRFSKKGYREMDLSNYERSWKEVLYRLFSNSYVFAHLFFALRRPSEYLTDLLLKRIVKSVSDSYR
ncbi:MAG TPA: NAD(P)/FAD-dependent oxidoreductase [Thermoplasmatales archaeon]|nr:NAD(P)/FAD-dependent oxidoreductase [Thermoplasmatales archaeon]